MINLLVKVGSQEFLVIPLVQTIETLFGETGCNCQCIFLIFVFDAVFEYRMRFDNFISKFTDTVSPHVFTVNSADAHFEILELCRDLHGDK